MQEEQVILDDWLRREVLPTIKELEKHPERARPADEVFAELKSEFRKKHMPTRKRA